MLFLDKFKYVKLEKLEAPWQINRTASAPIPLFARLRFVKEQGEEERFKKNFSADSFTFCLSFKYAEPSRFLLRFNSFSPETVMDLVEGEG